MLLHKLVGKNDVDLLKHRASHITSTSRLGGVAVATAIIVALTTASIPVRFEVLFCAIPVFLMGLSEDLNIYLKPNIRIIIASLSALIFMFFEGVRITSVGVPILDGVIEFMPISIFFTAFSIVALTNALNFIDGINGLASGKTLIVSGAIMALAGQYNEPGILVLSAAIFTSILGLFMLNYPHGRIFMGDAGAYTRGFLCAACLITIHHKHPEISPWAILLVIFWPICDMAHSILRRLKRGRKTIRADKMHMHHVVMRSLVVVSDGGISQRVANPLATAIILPLAVVPVFFGYVFRENNLASLSAVVALFCIFCIAYATLVRKAKRHAYVPRSINI